MNIQSHNNTAPTDTFVALHKHTPTVLQVPESLTARIFEIRQTLLDVGGD